MLNPIGTAIDPLAVINAEGTVEVLREAQTVLLDIVTEPVIETAKNRVHLLRDTHTSQEFGIQADVGVQLANIQQHLQQFQQQQVAFQDQQVALQVAFAAFQQQQATFQEQLNYIWVTLANTRVLSRNRRYLNETEAPHRLRPLHEYIAGDGHDLAAALCKEHILPLGAVDYHPNTAVGEVPQHWNAAISYYQYVDILRLVIFYNVDMGIEFGDGLPIWKDKVRAWLVEE